MLRRMKSLALFASASLAGCSSSSPAPPAAPAATAATPDPCAGVDTQTDGSNCGACGHDCQGGDCRAGRCQPILLATKQDSPRTLLLDSANVYVSSAPTGEGSSAGFVTAVPLGGGTATRIATGLFTPDSFAITPTEMYIGDTDLLRVPITGGTPTPLGTGAAGVGPVVVDASNVYFAAYGKNLAQIKKMPLAGGAATAIGEAHQGFYSLAIDSTNVYSATQASSNGSIQAVPLNGGPEIVIAEHQATVHSIVSDGTSVYWSNSEANGSVMMAPASGGAATTLASTAGTPAGLALDAKNLYYTDYQLGTINKVPLDKSAPSVIVSGLEAPEPIAVDQTCIYWASNDGAKIGRIMKVAK